MLRSLALILATAACADGSRLDTRALGTQADQDAILVVDEIVDEAKAGVLELVDAEEVLPDVLDEMTKRANDIAADWTSHVPHFVSPRSGCVREVVKVRPEEVTVKMQYKHAASAGFFPRQMEGLFWMDGNPWPETIKSFAFAEWHAGAAGCKDDNETLSRAHLTTREREEGIIISPHGDEEPCQGSFVTPWMEDRDWSVPEWFGIQAPYMNAVGRLWVTFVCGGPSSLELTICKFGGSFTRAVSLLPTPVKRMLKLSPAEQLNKMSLVKVNDNYWIRYTRVEHISKPGEFHQYHMKRIVNGEGEKTPYFQQFTSQGRASTSFEADVYGHGGDQRSHVANVTDMVTMRIVSC